ncbi:uncharacterized protein GO595_005083 [Histomonas meleagridis]|uniref:uncharacterized protein n=1 Tax=Histomonas meleagridis TaxID=135588 RepID=UPI0035599F43|nr:hypothetical protein GO595_005083 [Histomonas meleagridis]
MTAIKYFCAVNFNLPIPDGANPLKPVKESELLEKDEIFNLCKTILQPTIKPPINEKHVSCIAAPYSAIELLIKLEKDQTKLSKLLNALSSEEIQSNSIVYITFDDSLHFTDDSHQIMAQHVIDIVSQKHYETQSTLSPRLYALQRWINKTRPNFDEILQTIIDMNETKLQEIIDVQCCFIQIERSIELTQKAISTTNYIFADRISTTIYNEIERKLEKKVTLMMEDSTVFSKYVISKLESYYSKNQWLTSLLPMVARRFHSLIMQSFPLPLFAQVHKNQIILDQKFLNQKANLLQKLEGNELDPSVAKIVQNKSMFNPAQTPILRACLYENPIESVRQIVLSLCAVEDLFVFEYGTQPEANQLMPLLANLFILTPIPSPLMFGKWLAHFLQNLQQMKPEWFSDEELRPLEHYFQFNAWMEDMLQSFDE